VSSSTPPRSRARITRARAKARLERRQGLEARAVVAAHELGAQPEIERELLVEARREAVLDERPRRRVDLGLVVRVLAAAEPQEHLAAIPVAVVAVAHRPGLGALVDHCQQRAHRAEVRVRGGPPA
jgi:hypothetical protein